MITAPTKHGLPTDQFRVTENIHGTLLIVCTECGEIWVKSPERFDAAEQLTILAHAGQCEADLPPSM